jgi:NAD+ kinase
MARRKTLRVLIAGNADKTGVRAAARDLVRLIGVHRNLKCTGTDLSKNKPFRNLRADVVLALGGDGTVLNICRRLGRRQKPVLGIRFGYKGFLAEVLPEEMESAIQRLALGEYTLSERMRVEADVQSGGRRTKGLVALNEIALHAGPMARVVDVRVRVDGEQVLAYDGDGIIVATPTGSTAYSLAAGGPIVAQDVKAMVVTPVSPHTLAARPMVVGPGSEVRIDVHCRERKAAVTADGQDAAMLPSGSSVTVRGHKRPFLLVELGVRGRYQPVRDNLGWIPGSKRT